MSAQPSGAGSTGAQARDAASRWAVEYAESPDPLFDPPPDDTVRVELLTDPWSVWCWGFEPIRRALEHRYPSIQFRHLLGGMFETLPDPERQGFDLDRFFGTVHRTTGMPVTFEGMREDRPTSTYPACIHLHTVRLLDKAKVPRILRLLREAAYLDARNINREDVATGIVEQAGLDPDEFRSALDSGEPEREFRHRLEVLDQDELHAYPTLIFTCGETRTKVQGFQTLPSVISIAESVSGRLHPSMPAPEITEVVPEGERIATREIAEVLDTSIEQALEQLEDAREAGEVERERHPGGDVWTRS